MAKFENLHKSQFNNSKHICKIDWNSNITMKEYLDYVKICDNYDENIDDYFEFKIIGLCNIGEHLKIITINENEYMYIITDKDYKTLYASIGKCHPVYWYKWTSKKAFANAFDQIYENYNPVNTSTSKYTRGFMGNEDILKLSIHDIENHFILNKNTDNLLWGSLWQDHPFRYKYMKNRISFVENIIFTGQAMRQESDDNYYSMSVRTIFSQAIITVADYNGTFIMNIEYNPIHSPQITNLNNKLGRCYNINLPIDVPMAIVNFPFVNYLEILKMNNFSSYHVYILTLLTYNNLDEINNACVELKKLTNLDNDVLNDIEEYIEIQNK